MRLSLKTNIHLLAHSLQSRLVSLQRMVLSPWPVSTAIWPCRGPWATILTKRCLSCRQKPNRCCHVELTFLHVPCLYTYNIHATPVQGIVGPAYIQINTRCCLQVSPEPEFQVQERTPEDQVDCASNIMCDVQLACLKSQMHVDFIMFSTCPLSLLNCPISGFGSLL